MREDGRSRFTIPADTVTVAKVPVGLPARGRVTGRIVAVTGKTAIAAVPGYGEVVFQSEDMPGYVRPGLSVALTLTGTNVGQVRPGTATEQSAQPVPVGFMPDDELDQHQRRIRQVPGLRSYRAAGEQPKAPNVAPYAAHAAQAGDRLSRVMGRAAASDRLARGRLEALLPRSGAGMAASLTNMLVALSSGGLAAWLRLEHDLQGADEVVRTVSVDLPGMGAWQAAPFPFLTRPPVSWGWMAWREEPGIRKVIVDMPRTVGTRFQVRAAAADDRLDVLACLPPSPDVVVSPITFGRARAVARELGIELNLKVSADPSMIVDLSRACRIDREM